MDGQKSGMKIACYIHVLPEFIIDTRWNSKSSSISNKRSLTCVVMDVCTEKRSGV